MQAAAQYAWEVARATNQDNPCYIADLLATLYHGVIIPFKEPPPAIQVRNRDSLEMSSAAVAKEWKKMVDHEVVHTASADAPPFGALLHCKP